MTTTSAAHPAHGAQGFLLLTLNNVEATLPGVSDRIVDQLALECVTLPQNPSSLLPEPERDVWIVLRVGSNEFAISPTQIVRHSRADRTFIFENDISGGENDSKWVLKLPEPQGPVDIEDIETFEVVLSQYAAVEEVDPRGSPPSYSVAQLTKSTDLSASQAKRPVPPIPSQTKLEKPPLPPRSVSPAPIQKHEDDMRGRLVLVDEDDGEIVGTLGDRFNIHEDDAMGARGREKDPVIVDIPSDDYKAAATEVFVYPVPVDQQSKILKTASFISRGIVLATDAISAGVGAASSFYIKHSTPNEKPLVFSESTRGHVRRMHKISGTAVVVTSKTTGLIHDALGRAVDYMSGKDKGKASSRGPTPRLSPGSPPPRIPLTNRLFLATDMLLTTVEQSAKQLIEHSTVHVSEALGHKYGKDTGDASFLVGQSARNVGIVYIDARGVGRRALVKKAGARYIKAKLGKKDVVLGVDERGVISDAQPSPHASGLSLADRATTSKEDLLKKRQ